MLVTRSINGLVFDVDINAGSVLYFDHYIASQFRYESLTEVLELFYSQKHAYTPLALTWELTNNCNFNCPFCYINTSGIPKIPFKPFNELRSDIDYLVSKGLLMCYLTGGEALLHPDFDKIYTHLKQKGVLVSLLTNASLINETHLRLFSEYKPYKISVSIYGITDIQFSAITKQKTISSSYVLQNIIKLLELGINVTCQTPINKLSLGEYEKIGEWCAQHGIKYHSSRELSETYSGEALNAYSISTEEFMSHKNKIRRVGTITSQELPKFDNIAQKKHFDCKSGKHTFVLGYDYKLRPCFTFHNQYSTSFDANYSMETALLNMIEYIEHYKSRTISFCRGCSAVTICNECILTQSGQESLEEYMASKCNENQQQMHEIINQYPSEYENGCLVTEL